MKLTLITSLLLLTINLNAQDTTGIMSMPEYNVLYRNYSNLIEFMTNKDFDTIILKGEEVIFKPYKKSIVKVTPTGTCRYCSISMYGIRNNDSSKICTYKFRVSNLPTPSAYLGVKPIERGNTKKLKDEELFNFTRFFIKYPPKIPLNAVYIASKWSITIDNTEYTNNSPHLTSEFIEHFFKSPKGTPITINYVEYKGMGLNERIELNIKHLKTSKKRTFKPTRKTTKYSSGC